MDGTKQSIRMRSGINRRTGPSAVYSRGKSTMLTFHTSVYNIDKVDEIFIAKAPVSVRRNNGSPIIHRMVPGDSLSDIRMELEDEEEMIIRRNINPRSLFSNVELGKEPIISATVGVNRNGKIESESVCGEAFTKSDKFINGMLNRICRTEKTLTSSGEEKICTDGVNKDSIEVVPANRSRIRKKYVFIDGNIVAVDE